MNKHIKKKYKIIKITYSSLINLPAPTNISYLWNMGSMLGMCMMIQIISGFMLSMHYSATTENAFNSISQIMRNVNNGWMMRNMHANGASLMFMIMYMHIGRGMYYGSYKLKSTWTSGVTILLMTMATAFLGYVLPWGQMSFWGATVITNLMSAIPYMGTMMVQWIWGGFAVDNPTINRFFSLHFILPLMMTLMIMIHLMMLHNTGSSNPIGMSSNIDKIPFHPYFTIKDIMGFSIMMTTFMMLNLSEPFMLSDPDNFNPANPMITPIHIQPEWYFLFAYAILRSIPNKLGGVMGLLMSIMILIMKPMMMKSKFKSMQFYPISQILFWMFINTTIMLTWIGAKPVEEPFLSMSVKLTLMYFSYFITQPMITKMWEKIK